MFAPPPEIPCAVFARLPDSLRNADASHEWVAAQPAGGPERSLLEGPSFDRNGDLWCVDLPNGRILKLSPGGEFSVVARYDGWPNGLKIHRDGRVFIADHKHGLMVLDPASGAVRPWLERVGVERFKGVNDLFFAANGDLYFTDQGLTDLHDPSGRLFRVRADGRIDCLLDNIPSPNGLVMNADESALYLAVTRANAVWRVPLARDGGVVKVGTFIQLSGGGGPDGLALDAEGRLLVAHVGMGSVWVFDARGEPVGRIRAPEGAFTTNLAFGGPDNRSLFITESASATILRAEMPTPGKTMFSHQ
ncbi:MAG: SMP-30/gluconolactonase/LRE family protein [Acidibrevibacterium sp.]|uniref:SMP-30/gluconolactonase/LRE family protein n=1 Tax=Acidibrevibacterium fodinaquatile TaxID=1969806 RepID=UPI0023A81836|nr:SMP-30/gluconolactonase/LRE family protein [Acidibrevibacterium fodinaquatile]MCA7119895.1 SMP-30/gluconolactonase/LRE family protein [Acidibrevibacterium fodinaquatile]